MAGDPPERDGGWGGAGIAWSIIGYLLGGLLAWGGIGFLLDRLFGFRALFLPIGLVVGFVGGFYLAIVRFGRGDDRERDS
jgi:ATP synthase protein I